MVVMPADANPSFADVPADAEAFARYAVELGDAAAVALPRWVQRVVALRWGQWTGRSVPPELEDAAGAAAAEAATTVLRPLRALLGQDVAEQASNPLAVLRGAVRFPTRVLAAAGVPEVQRDADAERLFPDDVYDLTPGSFGDIDPELHDPGLRWGAAKARIVLHRRTGA